ncbi:MAG: WD40 repeat domain-containing protein [Treponema sp.]|nr:WD40 repeat domain-containing protein [Treponema sp.]
MMKKYIAAGLILLFSALAGCATPPKEPEAAVKPVQAEPRAEPERKAPEKPPALVKVVPQLGHSAAVLSIALSPDGSRIVSGSEDETIKLWDAQEGREIGALSGHSGPVSYLSYSSEDFILSASWDRTLKIWDLRQFIKTGQGDAQTSSLIIGDVKPVSLSVEGLSVSAALSPAGGLFASGDYRGIITLWEAGDTDGVGWNKKAALTGHRGEVTALAFNAEGTQLVSGSKDRTVILWDIATGNQIWTGNVHTGDIRSAAFSPGGNLVCSGSVDAAIKVWDATTGSVLRTLSGHTGSVESLAFNSDGKRLLSGSWDKTVRLWNPDTGEELRKAEAPAWVNTVLFSADGSRFYSGGYDNTVTVWDTEDFRRVTGPYDRAQGVYAVAVSPDGKRIVSGNEDKTLKVWELDSGRLLWSASHEWAVNSVAWSPDGLRVVSGSADWNVKVWNAETGVEIFTLNDPAVRKSHSQSVSAAAFSPNGAVICSVSPDSTIKVWNAESGGLMRTIPAGSELYSLAFAPDPLGRYIITGSGSERDNTVSVWDLQSQYPVPVMTFSGHRNHVLSLDYSPDGKRIISGSGNDIKIWDAESGELKGAIDAGRIVYAAAFSPDGTKIIAGTSKGIGEWDDADLIELREFRYDAPVRAVLYQPDGLQVISGAVDGTIRFWTTAEASIPGIEQGVETLRIINFDQDWVRLTPDGNYTASGQGERYLNFVDAGGKISTVTDEYRSRFSKEGL